MAWLIILVTTRFVLQVPDQDLREANLSILALSKCTRIRNGPGSRLPEAPRLGLQGSSDT